MKSKTAQSVGPTNTPPATTAEGCLTKDRELLMSANAQKCRPSPWGTESFASTAELSSAQSRAHQEGVDSCLRT